MTALARLIDAGSGLPTATEEVGHQKLAVQYIGRELRTADEANLLDEEDMHIFGLRPMTDPLDLIFILQSHKVIGMFFIFLEELCKSLNFKDEINLELGGPAVNRRLQRKERKKFTTTQTKKATSARGPKKIESVDSDAITASARESHMDGKIKIGNMLLDSTVKMNHSIVNPYVVNCSEDVTKNSLKPLKRSAAESPQNPGTKNLCKTAAEVLPYVPAPLATKIYYSQRNHLRRAICHMFFDESNKETSSEVANLEALHVKATPAQTSSPGNFCHEHFVDQQREDNFSHLVQTPDQILAATSDFYGGKSGAFVPCMDTTAQLTVNNNLGPHYISNSYSFSDKAGSPLSTLQQGSGSVPVV